MTLTISAAKVAVFPDKSFLAVWSEATTSVSTVLISACRYNYTTHGYVKDKLVTITVDNNQRQDYSRVAISTLNNNAFVLGVIQNQTALLLQIYGVSIVPHNITIPLCGTADTDIMIGTASPYNSFTVIWNQPDSRLVGIQSYSNTGVALTTPSLLFYGDTILKTDTFTAGTILAYQDLDACAINASPTFVQKINNTGQVIGVPLQVSGSGALQAIKEIDANSYVVLLSNISTITAKWFDNNIFVAESSVPLNNA